MTVSGPGDWTPDWDLVPAAAQIPPDVREQIAPSAVSVLWALTGRQFGLTISTVSTGGDNHSRGFIPRLVGGRWMNSNVEGAALLLPPPVDSVAQVIVSPGTPDEALLPPAAYRYDGSLLWRTDSTAWPPLVLVTYYRGYRVPDGGGYTAAVLGVEMARARLGGKCRLPARAQTVAREGVDVTMIDPTSFLEAGLTGIPEVDTFIRVHNPHRAPMDAVVWSPDSPRPGRRLRP